MKKIFLNLNYEKFYFANVFFDVEVILMLKYYLM